MKPNRPIRKLLISPAVYTFDIFLELTRDDIAELEYPDTLPRWGWFSAVELQQAIEVYFQTAILGKFMPTEDVCRVHRFDLVNFTLLNIQPADGGLTDFSDSFTWFICDGPGHLFLKRPGSSCPFNDPQLFVPAQWGKRVIAAVREGARSIELHGKSDLTVLYMSGARKSALHLLT